MALELYKNSGLTDKVSSDGTNPVVTTHKTDGTSPAQVVQLWLKNNDATKYYGSVVVDPTDAVSTDESAWVQLSLDGVTYQAGGAVISFNDGTFGVAGTADTLGHTFYMKVTSPSGQTVSNKTDIKLTVNYTEYAV